MTNVKFFSIIIGGGHSGLEAAYTISNLKKRGILIITKNLENIGYLACNPSMGGSGKSTLIKEIDYIGGIIGKLSDNSNIHTYFLNKSKGYSVISLRMQIDRFLYKKFSIKLISNKKGLTILQKTAKSLFIDNYKVKGLVTNSNNLLICKTIILTTGTFLRNKICAGHIFFNKKKIISNILGEQLINFPFNMGRLKTGTPPKLDKKTILFKNLLRQYYLTAESFFFSYYHKKYNRIPKLSCFETHTNQKTHAVILQNLDSSIIYTNLINSIGPRYCPSIEDKIIRFSNKKSHIIHLEPESFFNFEIYPNGISTSLSFSNQLDFVRTIKGLKKVNITRTGYAIEYDFINPQDLKISLESKFIKNLFLAGQINGTTGYEEASSQGLIAGINSFCKIKEITAIFLNRTKSYIGLLINDLINKGVKEPYRILNVKSKNSFFVRNDNIKLRLYSKKLKDIVIHNNLILKTEKSLLTFIALQGYFKKLISFNIIFKQINCKNPFFALFFFYKKKKNIKNFSHFSLKYVFLLIRAATYLKIQLNYKKPIF